MGGYCFGGTVAFEMAQRLRRAGEDVALLALFDTYNSSELNEGSAMRYLWQKITFHARNVGRLSLKEVPGYLSSKARVASDGELSALVRSVTSSLRGKSVETNNLKSHEASIQQINDAAGAAYHPSTYSGTVTIFKPKVNYDFLPDPKMGWGDIVTGSLEIIELPVNPHAMLVAPFVRELSAVLKAKLDSISTMQSNKHEKLEAV